MIAEGCPEFGHPAVVPFQTEKAGATNMAYTGALERQEVGGQALSARRPASSFR